MALNTSVSALRAISTASAVGANNVANINTEGFDRSRVTFAETQPAGVEVAATDRVDTQGPLRVNAAGDTVELSNTDLARETTGDITRLRSFQSNTAAVRTQDEMLGTLIDLKA